MALGNFYLTDAGTALLARAQTGAELKITRAQIGEGTRPAETTYANSTALVKPVKYLSIVSKTESSGQAKITVQFTNSGVGRAFNWTEFGLWAADPDYPDDRSHDILYGTAYAGEAPVPIDASLTEFLFNVLIKTGSATNVTVTIDSSLVYMTRSDAELMIEEALSEIDLSTVADKATLDAMDAKIGTYSQTGNTTVFSKLNGILTTLTGAVTDSMTSIFNHVKRLNDLFTDARVQKIDKLDAIDTNTATNNTASATGTLSQKLSRVISDLSTISTVVHAANKRLVTKRAAIKATSAGQYTLVNVAGAGIFHGAYNNEYMTSVTVTLDGVDYTLGRSTNQFAFGAFIGGDNLINMTSGTTGLIDVHFKSSLKIVFNAAANSMSTPTVTCMYSLYE